MQQDLGAYTMSWHTRLACNGGEPGEFLNDQQDRVKKRSKSWLTKYQLKANTSSSASYRRREKNGNESAGLWTGLRLQSKGVHVSGVSLLCPRPRNLVEVEREIDYGGPSP